MDQFESHKIQQNKENGIYEMKNNNDTNFI